MISAGAKILGGITIHENSKIGAGSVVLADVPPNSTVVGIPGKVIKRNGQSVHDLEHEMRSPVWEEITKLKKKITELENSLQNKE
jgi:serine O-acetyltransferase